ncbi:UNVERIFIED_CONTAM: hypothetical protein FKN15_053280 [Acipenser sinensis]
MATHSGKDTTIHNTAIQANLFTIKPLDNPLLCVCTVTPSEHLLSDSILIGDNAGFVNLVTISNSDLSSKKSEEKGQAQTLNHIGLRHPVVRRKLHNDWVLKVAFFPELNAFGSCSLDSDHSFVLEELQRLEDNQSVPLSEGVASSRSTLLTWHRQISSSFRGRGFITVHPADLASSDQFLFQRAWLRQGSDKIIRVWHPTMFSKPMGKLFGHLFTITHIAANEKDQHIISLCSARRTVQDTVQLPITHNMAVNVLVYNTALKQALIICSKSLVKVWELETGDQVYQIANAHGPHVELTAAAVDSAGFHLVTGGVDGSLKVWDFESGQDLKWKPPEAEHKEGDQSLVKLVYLSSGDQRSILTLHGNGAIQILQSPLSAGELTCLDVLYQDGNHLVVTGSTNGTIVLWDYDSATVKHLIHVIMNSPRKRNESYRVVQEDVADGDIALNEKTKGQFMKKVLPATRGSIVPLTAMCVSLDADLLLASNQKGYIILWDIIEVSKRNQEVVRQRLSWRAHSSPVTSIFYVDSKSVVLSASTDGSVRVWYAPKGHYIGYFGQHRVWQLRKPLEFTLPCDVSQHPLEVKTRGKSLVKKKQQEYGYPLILNWERPVYKKKQQISKPQVADKDVKFFKHLALPKIRSPAQVLPIPYLFVESSQDSKQSLSTGKTKCPKPRRCHPSADQRYKQPVSPRGVSLESEPRARGVQAGGHAAPLHTGAPSRAGSHSR